MDLNPSEMSFFLREFESLIGSPLFLTESTSEVREEIYHNCIYFSKSDLKGTDSSGLKQILTAIRENRKFQLKNSNLPVDLIYYSWFDEQAMQLRLCFINSNHKKLPFGCTLLKVDDEEIILQKFLEDDKEVLDWTEFTDSEDGEMEEGVPTEFILPVFQQIIKRV